MTEKPTTQWASSDWFLAVVSLFTLVTFVVAQSVYEVLAANQDFLALRGVSNQQLLEVVAFFNVLPALLLFFLLGVFQRWHKGVARLFLALIHWLLFLAFFLQLHNAYLQDWQPFPRAYLLWAVPALLLGLASLRLEKPFRSLPVGAFPHRADLSQLVSAAHVGRPGRPGE